MQFLIHGHAKRVPLILVLVLVLNGQVPSTGAVEDCNYKEQQSIHVLYNDCNKFFGTPIYQWYTVASAFDSDTTVVQTEELRIWYESRLTRNGLMCVKEKQTVKDIRFPQNPCSTGDLYEHEDNVASTQEEAIMMKAMYVGGGVYAFVYAPKGNKTKFAIRLRYPIAQETSTLLNMPYTELTERLCKIFTSAEMTQMMANNTIQRMHALSFENKKATDTLVLSVTYPSAPDIAWADTTVVLMDIEATPKKNVTFTWTKVMSNSFWMSSKEALPIYHSQVDRTRPKALLMYRRAAEVTFAYGLGDAGMVIPSTRMAVTQLIGCPIHLCHRADLEGLVVDEFNVIRITLQPDYKLSTSDKKMTAYFYSSSFISINHDFSVNPDGSLPPIDMARKPVLFEPEITFKSLVLGMESNTNFPVSCALDAMALVSSNTKEEVAQTLNVRVAWLIAKDTYVYLTYFHIDYTQSENMVKKANRFYLTEMGHLFPNGPTHVEAMASVQNGLVLLHENQVYLFRFFFSLFKCKQAGEVLVFDNVPNPWSGVYGFRSSFYFFAYSTFSNYTISPKTFKVTSHGQHEVKHLFANCPNNFTYDLMHYFNRTKPLVVASIKTAVLNNVWGEQDTEMGSESNLFTISGTTASITAMTQRIFAVTMQALESSSVNYHILLGSSMGVLFIFLIMLIFMEMLRRKSRRRRRRGGSKMGSSMSGISSRSQMGSRSVIPSSSGTSKSGMGSSTGSRSAVSSNVTSKSRMSKSKAGSAVESKSSRK